MIGRQTVLLLTFLALILFGCNKKDELYTLSVKNELQVQRNTESVAVIKSDLGNITSELFSRLSVKDGTSGAVMTSQVIDEDMDGEPDLLIFQPDLGPGETKEYYLVAQTDSTMLTVPQKTTFSRFVPERTDDYAWENDRVAFRTYGPVAQKMVEDKIPGGTLTSGMDCWLKRVDYPIIDKWYKKTTEKSGSYHQDEGEGLDNFHVGASRGCGGTGLWDADEKILYTSKNFVDWQTMAVGPIRTQFELKYAPWSGKDITITERKIISLDLGSNLTRYEIVITSDEALNSFTTGLTLHKKDGQIKVDTDRGWFSYWQPFGDSELGMGIVVHPKYVQGYSEHMVEEADLSHLLVHMKPVNGKVVYYAGFGWQKSGQYQTEEEWISYLQTYADKLSSPLIVKISPQ
jgi:hypothetical protein